MQYNQGDDSASNRWQAWVQEESARIHVTDTQDSPNVIHDLVPPTAPLNSLPVTINMQTYNIQSKYGPIFDCVSYDVDNHYRYGRETTCGFHVHKISWDRVRSYIDSGSTIHVEITDLRACPLYNYTFCNVFNLTNNYDKTPPHRLPNCYCGYPVELEEERNGDFCSFFFVCKNLHKQRDERCTCYVDAKEVFFAKSEDMLHTHVDVETYQVCEREQRARLEHFENEHRSNLLATLSAEPTTGATYNSVVPVSIMEANQKFASYSESTPVIPSLAPNKTSYELQEEALSLEHSLSRIKQNMKLLINNFKMRVPNHMIKGIYLRSEQELFLRINGQERVSNIEAGMLELAQKHEKQTKEFELYKEKVLEQYEYKKCKVCYSRDIEYILVPCFHFGKCLIRTIAD
ncbi:hypothetical protein HPULCUR_006486 [Helicostylum pulchrum]|uniref:Uncharacterized protein n=1 Tax=Helicostylum pulchrum TaxID=562976 RepID=A0ABP9Y227_9FUNG